MNDSIPYVNSIFEQPWWLDAVAPGQWNAIEVRHGNDIMARLPYVISKRFGFKTIGVPVYTQTLGIWLRDTGAKNSKKYEQYKKSILEIIDNLPKACNYDFIFDHSFQYVLPFRWRGFESSVAYSYRLEDISDEQQLWGGLKENIRTDIKKAKKQVAVRSDMPLSILFEIQKKTFSRQGRRHKEQRELLSRLDAALVAHSARKFLCAVDENDRVHAAAYFVYDENTCYYLIGGGDPDLRNSGAASLLLWEGILFASTVCKAFDFEGSCVEDIERFFRGFGGVPTPYYRVTRFNPVIQFAEYIKPKIKKMIRYKL